MNKKIALTLVTLGFGISYADEVYKLRSGENISSLLVDRLKHPVIYRNHYLDRILKFNNLTRQSARKLRIGAEIKVPSDVIEDIATEKATQIAVAPAPVATEVVPEVIVPSAPAQYYRWLRLSGEFKSLSGSEKSSTGSNDYSLFVLKPNIGLGFDRLQNGHELYSSIDGSYVKLAPDELRTGRGSFLLFEGKLLYQKRLNEDWALGALGKYGQDIYVEVKPSKNYEFQTPWIYGIGPHLSYKNLGLSYLFIPDQKVVSDLKTKGNSKILLNYRIKHHDNYWEVEGAYADSSMKDVKAKNLSTKIQYTWSF